MWVELVGLPGVGKSTWVERHRAAIQRRFRVVVSRRAGPLVPLIERAQYHLRLRWRTADRELARKLAWRAAFRAFLRRGTDVFFQDSGMVQVVLENLIGTGFADLAAKESLLARLRPADALLVLEDDPAAVLGRELGRTPRRFNLAPPDLAARYERAAGWIGGFLGGLAPAVRFSPSTPWEEVLSRIGACRPGQAPGSPPTRTQ